MDDRREQFFHHTVADFVELVRLDGFAGIWDNLPPDVQQDIIDDIKDTL